MMGLAYSCIEFEMGVRADPPRCAVMAWENASVDQGHTHFVCGPGEVFLAFYRLHSCSYLAFFGLDIWAYLVCLVLA